MKDKHERSMLVKSAGRDRAADAEEESKMAVRVVIAIAILFIITIVIVACSTHNGNGKSSVSESVEEKTVEEVEEEYEAKLEDARRDTLDQHIQLVMVDNDALAVDLVYIDGQKDKHYVEYLLGDNSWDDTMKRDYAPDISYYNKKDSYELNSDYTIEQFDELTRVFERDKNAKMLAVSIVEEYYDDSDNDLTIPNRRMRQSIKNGLKSGNEDDDEKDGVNNDKPHASISKKSDQPKYDKNYGKN